MYRWTLVSTVLLGLFMAGCGRPQTSSSAPGAPANAGTVTVKGSDTMVHLVAAWAEHYMKEKAGTEISVTGGGTGTGIAALINGSTDICAASREMSAKEKEQAQAKSGAPAETVVALDGIAVIVHPSNPIGELTLEQLKKIFTGAWTDWAETGSGSGQMIVLSRESSSGTYVFFQEHVLKKEDYTPKAKLMPATSAILQAVGEDRLAIGYVGLGYTAEVGGRVKVLNIKADDASTAVAPSEGTVRDGSYSISRPLYLYTSGQPTGPAGEFIQFCLGAAGQQIVLDNGYVPVK